MSICLRYPAGGVLILSMGGQFLLPILVPGHVWAARRSGSVGRVLWSLPAGIAAATYVWIIVYEIAGEPKPVIWLAPLMAAVAGVALVLRLRAGKRKEPPAERLRERIGPKVGRNGSRS